MLQVLCLSSTQSRKDLGHTRSRTPYTVEQSWHFLTPEQRATIAERALRIGYEDPEMATGALTLHQGERSITGADHYNFLLNREARGNHLKALRHLWHDSGELINDPGEMAKIWRLAGYPHPISQYNAPWTEAPGVLPAYLAIQKPLVTTDQDVLKTKVIPALEEAFKRDRTRRKEFGADDWDKNTRYTPREWLDALKEDVAAGKNSFVWTSIPDKVTDALRKIGFDGIYDEGGKMGGQGHTVAIPFEKHQVRSAYAARLDPAKKDSGKLLASSAPTDPLTTQMILRQYGKEEE